LAALAGVAVIVLFLGTAPVSAATPIGVAFTPITNCGASTFIQSTSPGGSYAAPFSGVITSWSYQADATPPSLLRLKVARSAGGDSFLVVGQSDLQMPDASVPNPFPTRISVQAGDVIGLYQSELSQCGIAAVGFSSHQVTGTDVQPSDMPVTFTPGGAFQLDIGAAIEPDADQDGFGDETQDNCLGTAGAANGCPSTVAIPPSPTSPTSPTCDGRQASILGTEGADQLSGTPQADVIAGLGGNDKLSGLAGNDVICGGTGRDTLKGGKGNDKLLGDAGKDTLTGGPDNDKLKGGAGKDKQIQ
jgi:RTX calcium-binding nonapeptide repeat (4 copies)